MLQLKPYLIVLGLLTTATNYSQFTDVINSNRPGESMAAFSVGKTVIQAELGFYGFREKHPFSKYDVTGYGSDLAIRYGAFFEQLEFILDLKYQNENYTNLNFIPGKETSNKGLKQTTIGAKFLFYDPIKNYEEKPNLYSWKANHKFSWRQFIPAVGVYAGFNINLAKGTFDRPYYPLDSDFSPKVTLLTQNQFGKFVFITNIGLDNFGTTRESFDYVITLTRGFNPRWSGFIENQSFNSKYYSDAIFRIGAAYLVKQNIQVDAAIGTNIKNTPSLLIGQIGLSWRFDENYNELFLRIPKEEKGDKKKNKKDKDKKDKAKKRIDEIEGEKTN